MAAVLRPMALEHVPAGYARLGDLIKDHAGAAFLWRG
jgi:hypothetical protein